MYMGVGVQEGHSLKCQLWLYLDHRIRGDFSLPLCTVNVICEFSTVNTLSFCTQKSTIHENKDKLYYI